MKIRKGAVIIMMGMLGLVYGLVSSGLAMIERISITIFCIVIIIIGVLIENPIIEQLSDKQESLEKSFE